jgi:hypothetical protein
MFEPFFIKQGDTSPAIRFALEPATINLTGASVRFRMRARNGVTVVDAVAGVVEPTGTPTVAYEWQAADTVTAGLYEAEFEVTYADGKIETFPNTGFIKVRMEPEIAAAVASGPPGAFIAGQWALADVPSSGANRLGITLSSIPAGASAVFYSLNDGTNVLLAESPAINAQYMITVPAGAAATIRLFATNAFGTSGESDAKTATPTLAPPVAFTAGQWALADSPSAGGIRLSITLSAIPATTTVVRYSLNGGPVTLLTSSPATGTPYLITVPALTLASVRIFATNAGGSSGASDAKTATPSSPEVAPSAFTAGMWTLTDSPSPGADTLTITITALPSDGGSPITALQYSLNAGGAWSTLSGTGTGARNITVLASTAASVILRAVNAVGNGPGSDTKSATPTSSASTPLTAVSANGWQATHPSPPSTIGLADNITLPVQRPGWTAAGAATTVTEDLIAMARLRQPFPNQTTLSADTVVLSDWVRSGDVLPAGVTNGSTRPYWAPQTCWLQHDRFNITGATFSVDLVVTHPAARNGRPVAAVLIRVSDGTTTREQLVSTLTFTSYALTGLGVDAFRATFTAADFAAGVPIVIDAIIYPWVGPSYQLSVNGTGNDLKNTPLTAYKVPVVYAYLSPTGNDTSGVASTDPAVAAGNPCLTIAGAATKIRQFNNANYTRDEIGGGVIRFPVGTWVIGQTDTGSAATHPITTAVLTYESINPADKATTILRDNNTAKNSAPNVTRHILIQNVTLEKAGNNPIFRHYETDPATFVLRNVDVKGNGTATSSWINRTRRFWAIECRELPGFTGTAMLANVAGSAKNVVCFGSTVGGNCVISAIACRLPTIKQSTNSSVTLGFQRGMLVNNFVSSSPTSGFVVEIDGAHLSTEAAGGYAVVGNVIERASGSGGAVQAWADNNTSMVHDFLFIANTLPGSDDVTRFNRLYSDLPGATGQKNFSAMRFNVMSRSASKSDVFAAATAAVGNWPVAMGVAHAYNTFIEGNPPDGQIGAGSWRREVVYPGLQWGDGALGNLDPLWTDDQSATGGAGGNGDYRPQAGSPLQRIPAGQTITARDMLGQAIPIDGTAFVGALQS